MAEALRKCVALLSVLLLLTAFRCMASCIAGDSGSPAGTGSTDTPPCHKHQAPAQETQHSAPCQNHPGLLAWSLHQPSAQIDLHVNLLAVVEPLRLVAGRWEPAGNLFVHTPPLPRPPALSSIVLRI